MSTSYRVEGMTCDHCVRAVVQALEQVPGVVRVVEVSRQRGEAIVIGAAEPNAVIAAIETAGYQAFPGVSSR